MEEKTRINIPYDLLPEAREWKMGKTYRVKTVLKQVGADEKYGVFEIVDASSMEMRDRANRSFMSETGSYKGE